MGTEHNNCYVLIQLNPETVWLQEESPGHRAFFPDPQNTRFLFSDDVGTLITDFKAMGSPSAPQTPVASQTTRVSSVPWSGLSEASTSTAPASQLFTATRKTQSTNVKIVQASMKRLSGGKMDFTPQNQTFVDVTEATANLHYVSSAIERKWGPEYVLVTADGLKLDDSSGTQGMMH